MLLGVSITKAQDFYDLSIIREFRITFDKPKYDSILQQYWHDGDKKRLLATVEIDGQTYDSVGVRYKGNFTFIIQDWFNNPKFPLNIDLDYVKPQGHMGFTKFKLGNAATDPTYIREALTAQIYRKYLPASRMNFARVYINGNYMGLFSNAESINRHFLGIHFGEKDGAFFKCDPVPSIAPCVPSDSNTTPDLTWHGPDSCLYYNNYEIKSTHGWADLLELIDILNNGTGVLDSIINIDRVLWHLAVSTVIPNLDTYNGRYIHNYYLFRGKSGLFQIIPWDLNESWGGIMSGTNATELEEWNPNYGYDPYVADRPLVYKILGDDTWKKQYHAHIRTIMDENYDQSIIKPLADAMQAMIRTDAQNDPYFRFTMANFTNNVQDNIFSFPNFPFMIYGGILSTLNNRKDYLSGHSDLTLSPPDIMYVEHPLNQPVAGEKVWITTEVNNATTVELMVTKNEYNAFFVPVEMLDDGDHHDGEADDGVYGGLIPFMEESDDVKYYIRAQNDQAMKLEPQRAEYQFFEYTVDKFIPMGVTNWDKEDLYIVPNPNTGSFALELPNRSAEKIRMTNSLGQQVSIIQDRSLITLRSAVPGIYLLHIPGHLPQKVVIISK